MDRRQAGSYGGLRRGSPLAGDVLYMACLHGVLTPPPAGQLTLQLAEAVDALAARFAEQH